MLRTVALLVGLGLLIWWSIRLVQQAWRSREAPLLALFRLGLAYGVFSLSLLLAATMLEWRLLIDAARILAWPLVATGEGYLGALHRTLPQALVPLTVIGSALVAATAVFLLYRILLRTDPARAEPFRGRTAMR